MNNPLFRPAPSRLSSIVSVLALAAFLPLLLIAMYQSVQLISRASGTKADIVVNAKAELEEIQTGFYHALAQGGEESGNMLAPVQNEIATLKPKMIRLDHIFDSYNVVSKNGSELTYNFDKLDAAVNTILTIGAKPLLALSFMPAAIAKDGVIINPPNDWEEWAQVVKRTVEHYSGKGEKNISGIYYEVWNEPDLEQFGKWKMGGEKNYLTLYQYAAKGAQAAQNVNGFMIGGPSTTGLYKNWITALAASGMRVDFFSWHSYLSDPTRFASDQKNIATWLLSYPSHIAKPNLITEFGFTGSKSGGYGTTYAAAHAAAVIRQLLSGGPTYLFTFEPVDGPGQDDGSGWGLLTHPSKGKKPKPRYYIFSFLDAMAGKRLELTGEGSWVTSFATKKGETIRILLVNFDASGSHTEQVPVTVENLTNGSYTIKERFLFGSTTQTTVTVDQQILQKSVLMKAQSIAILEITPS